MKHKFNLFRNVKNPLPYLIFIALTCNLILAPAIYGSVGEPITRNVAYALGILLLVVFGLSVYLFMVIFQPERF
jgi:K+-transporting ATPase KdpF subunit